MRERTKQMNFRVYASEQTAIRRKAKQCGVTISEYVRNCALDRRVMEMPRDGLYEAYRKVSAVRQKLSEYKGTESFVSELKAAQDILLGIYSRKEDDADGGNEDMVGQEQHITTA